MLKKYIGKSRAENLDWLVNVWLKDGPPVCLLQGFSGVGKTEVANELLDAAEKQQTPDKRPKWKQAVRYVIAERATPSVIESLIELSSILSQRGLPEMEKFLFEQKNADLGSAFEVALERPVVIVLDEAQLFFRSDTSVPLPELERILARLGSHRNLPGRLLLVSDRAVGWSHGSEWVEKRTLKKLEPAEAIEVLDLRMKEAGIAAEISPERKQDVIQALDYNPRAIEALVGALQNDSLDEIIESDPGLWAVHDREVSRDFLRGLERRLLERTLSHLEDIDLRRIWRLSVHRRSFKREVFERLCGNKDEASKLRAILESRYLLNFHKGVTLNPIAREISLTHLRDEPAEFKQAQSGAADYHLRHFKAKQIVGSQTHLGDSFAELRYHLVMAGREAEIGVIGQRFTDHLKRELHSTSPVPTDREELDERIGVLTVLLGDGGAKGLEEHLARCLQQRKKIGDVKLAALHAARATGVGTSAAGWYLRADLENQAEGLVAAMRTIYEAIHKVSSNDNLNSLYQLGADLLGKAGKTDEAVALLKDGIKIIPPDKNLFSLYQNCADLLGKAGKTDEAVALLKDGIKIIPPDKNLFSLYQICAEVYSAMGRFNDALVILREGLGRIPEQFGRYSLAEGLLYLYSARGDREGLAAAVETTGNEALSRQCIALGSALNFQMQGDWSAAADTATAASREFPRYFSLTRTAAFSRLAAGDANSAWETLSNFPNFAIGAGEAHCWLTALIHLRRGAHADASAALAIYLGHPVDSLREVSEHFLLRLWNQQEPAPEGRRLSYYFPIMPASLSGLSHTIHRIQFGKPVLPPPSATPTAGTIITSPTTPASTATTEVYVSYSWGEDTTETGRQREEIVDRLCIAVSASGRAIGRDKDRMRGGDSIERFANEISKAARIVAVISEKSLHSKYCMVLEIYGAWRRCNHRVEEFQKKVVALVMDDARPLLADDLQVARFWKAQYEKEKIDLLAVDPDRHSTMRWAYLNQLGEMCPKIPDLLGALKDIVMKRGFEEITKDGFQEVIRLLPSSPT